MIEVAESVFETLCAESRVSVDGRETGGIVLGHDFEWRIVVTSVGTPGSNADRQPDSFLRDLEHSRLLADEAFEREGSVWLGEWHTHPTGGVSPSPVDIDTYQRLLMNDELAFSRIVSLVVCPCFQHGWSELTIGAWIMSNDVMHLSKVIRVDCLREGGEF